MSTDHWSPSASWKIPILLWQKEIKRAMGFCRSQAVVTVYRCRNSASLSESNFAGIKGKGVAIVSSKLIELHGNLSVIHGRGWSGFGNGGQWLRLFWKCVHVGSVGDR